MVSNGCPTTTVVSPYDAPAVKVINDEIYGEKEAEGEEDIGAIGFESACCSK